uniref:Isochorismatase hydrolase n=1 Tax=Mycena chlorophos TaxID=658473 RepID=A0ABQ0MB23_MYCCL|nr:isochorismatase hydrolase [Mycena chlorophos]
MPSSESSSSSSLSSSPSLGMLRAQQSRRVLLILDAQHAVLSPPPLGNPIPRAPTVLANLKHILATARGASHPPQIVHIRNTGDRGELDEPSAPGWALALEPKVDEGEVVLDKRKNNAFSGTRLGEVISEDAEVVVVGLQTDFSLRATCSAALARGNSVLLIREAHGTYDRVEILYGGGVTPAKQVEKEIEDELEEAGVNLLGMEDVRAIFDDR